MTLEKFEMLIERYGTDLTRWPKAAGRDAQALLGVSIEAKAALAAAARLDAWLRAHDPAAAVGEDRMARLMAAVNARIDRPQARSWWQRPTYGLGVPPGMFRLALQFGAPVAAAALLGVFVDELLPQHMTEVASTFQPSIWTGVL